MTEQLTPEDLSQETPPRCYPPEQGEIMYEEMLQAVPKLFEITPRVQLIALDYRDELKTLNGVFDNIEDLTQHAISCNLAGYQVGYLLNELKPDFPTTNKLASGEGVKAIDIARRVRLPLDVDPKKSGDEATENERHMGEVVFDGICEILARKWNFPLPLKERSGNGCQGTWRIDLEVNEETDKLIQDFQRCFGKYISAITANYATVDMGVHLRNQHLKLPGTFSRKGEPTPERPQRLAHFVKEEGQPDNAPFVARETLEAFVAGHQDYLTEKYNSQKKAIAATTYEGEQSFEASLERVEAFCDAMDITVEKKEHSGSWCYLRLDRCLYHEEREGCNHRKKTNHAFICIEDTGKIGAGCHRSDCKDDVDASGLSAWEYLKRLADPDYAARAEEWDKKRERAQKDQGTTAQWKSIGVEAMKNVEAHPIPARQETVRTVVPEIVEDEVDWNAFVDDILANKTPIDKVFDEAFLTYLLSLPRKELGSIRQQLYEDLRAFDVQAFNTALFEQKNKLVTASSEGAKDEQPPSLEGEETPPLVDALTPAPYDFDRALMAMCVNSGLQETNRFQLQSFTGQLAAYTLKVSAGMQMVQGLIREKALDKQSAEALVKALNNLATPKRDAVLQVAYRFPFNAKGNSLRVAECYRDILRYCAEEDLWYFYEEGKWCQDIQNIHTRDLFQRRLMDANYDLNELLALPEEARSTISPQDLSVLVDRMRAHAEHNQDPEAIHKAMTFAETERVFQVKLKDFDTHPALFNVLNGTIDLRTGDLLPHDPNHLLRKQAPLMYDPEATCPHWLAFIDHITGGNHEYAAFLQRVSGYVLTGTNDEKIFLILYGLTGTGKSTWTDMHQRMMGEYAFSSPHKTILDRETDASGNELVDLRGRRLAYISEVSERQRLSEATLKALSGGGMFTARANYKGYEQFYVDCKIMIDTNEIPLFNAYDEAFVNRLVILPFDFPIQQRVKGYAETVLADELPGILNWSLAGSRQWYDQGLNIPDFCLQKRQEVRDEKDRVREFLDACCVRQIGHFIQASVLHGVYQEWCLKSKYHALNIRNFGMALANQPGVEKRERNDGNYYEGVNFKDHWKPSVWKTPTPTKQELEAKRDALKPLSMEVVNTVAIDPPSQQ